MTSPITITGERPIKIASTPLGPTDLVPVAITAEEEISRPYLFTVDFVSPLPSVTAAQVLGKAIALRIPVEGTAPGDERIVHGLVRRFTNLGRARGLTRYRAELVPSLWFMTLSSNSRTFENQSVVDIVREVCRLDGVQDFKTALFRERTPPKLPYVVQYRETDFDFVSRLLEEAGLYYVFEHETDGNTLVVSDAFGNLLPISQKVETVVRQQTTAGTRPLNSLFDLSRDFAVLTKGVDLFDHDLLRANAIGQSPSELPGARGRRLDFQGDLGTTPLGPESQRLVEVEEARHDVLHGKSNCPAFEAGSGVKMTGDPITADDGEILLVRVKHSVTIGDVIAGSGFTASYSNEWTGIPSFRFFRPPRVTPRPSVRGTQTAKIVGAGGDGAIDVDASGRVLLKFPWDEGAGKGGKSQHRVHVASAWAGQQWGFVQLPRVGQEVLVEYLEGDPSRPIVTGRVYDSANKPPYTLPANKTQSGWKSRTLGGTADNFNEIRFEDKKGSEHVHVQAESALQVVVKGDETRSVGRDRTTKIQRNDTTNVTEGNSTYDVQKGNQRIEVVDGTQDVLVKTGDQQFAVQTGNQIVRTFDGKQFFKANGDQNFVCERGDHVIRVTDGKSDYTVETGPLTVRAVNDNLTLHADIGDVSVTADAGAIKIEAAQAILLRVGSNEIKIEPSGITISGAEIKLTAAGQLVLSGAVVKTEGDGMVQMKGPMVLMNGDGMLSVKGGVTMIN